jgi:hypothetical protein
MSFRDNDESLLHLMLLIFKKLRIPRPLLPLCLAECHFCLANILPETAE